MYVNFVSLSSGKFTVCYEYFLSFVFDSRYEEACDTVFVYGERRRDRWRLIDAARLDCNPIGITRHDTNGNGYCTGRRPGNYFVKGSTRLLV